jgi:hydroxylamine reductase
VLYGLKGVASYAFHAYELGQEDEQVYRLIYRALEALNRHDLSLDAWVKLALDVGETNLRVMELLDAGHTHTYGHPIPTAVPITPRAGKAMLVSGHDIRQLEAILNQTEGTGISVYTHGELLPAHGYPKLKQRYPHLYGHYGTAWQNQTEEFAQFPGAIVITTNCLMPPHDTYSDKLFTLEPVGFPHLNYLPDQGDGIPDFAEVIQKSLDLPGFETEAPRRTVNVSFAHKDSDCDRPGQRF